MVGCFLVCKVDLLPSYHDCWVKFYIDWSLALICLAGAPLIGIIISIIRKRLRKMSLQAQETMGDIHH